MKSQSYMTRALQARDPRFARILGKLGYETKALQAAPAEAPASTEAELAPKRETAPKTATKPKSPAKKRTRKAKAKK